jgi:hypothetical protein
LHRAIGVRVAYTFGYIFERPIIALVTAIAEKPSTRSALHHLHTSVDNPAVVKSALLLSADLQRAM